MKHGRLSMAILGAKNPDFWRVLGVVLWLCYAFCLPGVGVDQGRDVRRLSRVTSRRVLVKFVIQRQIICHGGVPTRVPGMGVRRLHTLCPESLCIGAGQQRE
jgi:hypothetical protein